MKIKILLIMILLNGVSFAWGEKGHKLIAKKAIEILEGKIKNIVQYKDYIAEHSIEPDLRKDIDKTEGPKHYIDIDFYEEFLSGNMIYDKNQLISVYGDSVVEKTGLLPWATIESLQNLTKAFKEKNRDKILIHASDLAHYVADAHQPMHTLLNYDGQFTGQNGIHSRYESDLIHLYLDELEEKINISDPVYVEEPRDFIFSYIMNSFSVSEVIFASDKFASLRTGSTRNEEYYRLLWFRTKYITEIQFESASNALAALIYTAWVNGGKPLPDEID